MVENTTELQDVFKAVTQVADIEHVRTNEALEKGRSADGDAVLGGGVMNRVVTEKAQDTKKSKERASEAMLMQIILNEANNHLALAEKYIEQAEQAEQAMENIAKGLQKTDEGNIDHDYYARELLSEAEYAATGGDTTKIQETIAKKYLDVHGSREIDHPYVRWIEKDNVRQGALVNARDHIEKAEELNGTIKSQNITLRSEELKDRENSLTRPGDMVIDKGEVSKTEINLEVRNNELSNMGL